MACDHLKTGKLEKWIVITSPSEKRRLGGKGKTVGALGVERNVIELLYSLVERFERTHARRTHACALKYRQSVGDLQVCQGGDLS